MLDEQVIQPDFAELVDDDRGLRQVEEGVGLATVPWGRLLEQAVEQRRLASAEKAGQHRKRKGRRRARGVACRHWASAGAACGGGFGGAGTAGLGFGPAAAADEGAGFGDWAGLAGGAAGAGF